MHSTLNLSDITNSPGSIERAAVDPIYDDNLSPKHRKAIIRQRLAQIDVEIVHLQNEKKELRDLHAGLK